MKGVGYALLYPRMLHKLLTKGTELKNISPVQRQAQVTLPTAWSPAESITPFIPIGLMELGLEEEFATFTALAFWSFIPASLGEVKHLSTPPATPTYQWHPNPCIPSTPGHCGNANSPQGWWGLYKWEALLALSKAQLGYPLRTQNTICFIQTRFK